MPGGVGGVASRNVPYPNQKSNAARRDVAINVIASAKKDDPVTRRVGLVVFQLVVRDDNPCADVDMFAAQWFIWSRVGDDGHVFVAIDFE
jgi:hypothetical protein